MKDNSSHKKDVKRILLVTYYWPPAGGPGVQRWLKFVKYLQDFGVEPIVYVPENPNYPMEDASLISEIPSNIRILKKPIFEPYKLAGMLSKKDTRSMSSGMIENSEKQSFLQKSMLYVRGNFFIPDARKFWVKPSVDFLSEFLAKEKIETLITTGPPHSLHLIGLELKKKMKLRWIADFRDPWTSIGYQQELKLTKSSREKHQQQEKEVLQTADTILTTSFTTKKEFQMRTKRPIEVITNGYDVEPTKEIMLDEKFSVSHIGSLLAERNPKNLWQAFSELAQENEEFKKHFRLQLIGKVSQEVLDAIQGFGLEEFVELVGYVPHQKAVQFQQKSQILLLLEIDRPETRGIIPGKLFEYMRSGRPILAIGPGNWDVEKIIEETHTGVCMRYAEKDKIKKQILTYFENYQAGNLGLEPSGIEKYSRRNLTEKLAKVITNKSS